MSAVAGLYNVPDLGQPESLATWGFVHAAHHRDIIRRIYELALLALPEYILDPINPNDMETWTYQHQQMHNDMDTILGISGFNLDDVDWKNKGQLSSWVALHAAEHLQAANILGIG